MPLSVRLILSAVDVGFALEDIIMISEYFIPLSLSLRYDPGWPKEFPPLLLL